MRTPMMIVALLLPLTSSAAVEIRTIDEACRVAEFRSCLNKCYGPAYNPYSSSPDTRFCSDLQQLALWGALAKGTTCDLPSNSRITENCTRVARYADAKDVADELEATKKMMNEQVVAKIEQIRQDFIREVNQVFDRIGGGDK